MNELALFAGAGGGILGGVLLGWTTVCAVEIEPYAAGILVQRQNDGILPPFPVWDDVKTFDGKPWRGIVDVISGGFPCQDISVAGKGTGIEGEKSGLWKEFARIISEVQPRFVFVENSPMLTGRGIGTVLGDLASLGYDATWGVVSASEAGAPHKRERIWIVANSNGQRELQPEGIIKEILGRACDRCQDLAHSNGKRQQELHPSTIANHARQPSGGFTERWAQGWWSTEPDVGRVADGVAARMDRLKALGNGQVPEVARIAWETLKNRM